MHSCWNKLFEDNKELLDDIKVKIGKNYFPKESQIFRVFEMDIKEINIVLLGQDPYHDDNQAHGLSFSVPKDLKQIPPSLKNIYKELLYEYPDREYRFSHGCLENWFYREKIFLLNSALTVEPHKAGSHLRIWETFTDKVIEYISNNNERCVFLLLGNYAINKSKFINKDRIVQGVHPSPLSANRGFFNSNIFINVEKKLNKKINWNI